MKKVLVLAFVFLLAMGLTSCDRGYLEEDDPSVSTTTTTTISSQSLNSNADVDYIVAILNANSYLLTVHDASSIQYFTANTLENNYGIYVTVTDLIMGDVNANDWVQVVGFGSEADAISYANALSTLDGGELYYRHGTAVLLTYSQNALNLF